MAELKSSQMMIGRYNFVVGSNVTNFFAIGDFLAKNDFYLIGYHESNGKIAISGQIFSSTGRSICMMENSEFTRLDNDLGILKTVEDQEIEVTDKKGNIVFSAKTNYKKILTLQGPLSTSITEVIGDFYNAKGELVAVGTKHNLELMGVKAVFGGAKSGSLGFVMGCSGDKLNFIRTFARMHL